MRQIKETKDLFNVIPSFVLLFIVRDPPFWCPRRVTLDFMAENVFI